MPSSNTARGLLGLFLRGKDLPVTNLRATTLPVRLPTSSSLGAILAAGAGGRGAQGGTSGRKGPRKGRGRSAGEGGRYKNGTGQTCG